MSSQENSELDRLRKRVAELEAALKPFAGAVFNDNSDMTVSYVHDGAPYIEAYRVLRRGRAGLGDET